MRFIVDECTGPLLARWLREHGHDVFSVFEEARGITDDLVIQKANEENRILVTNDKDFGEKVFKSNMNHKGVILLRLQDERSKAKIEILNKLLGEYSDKLPGKFVVVTERQVRFAGEIYSSLK
jgi:predicted nuclease of predicted toxin-antitoxin system